MTSPAGTGSALLETDRRGVITYGNDLVAPVTGFQPTELVGRHLTRLTTRADGAVVGHSLATAASHGADRVDIWQLRKDGSRFRSAWVVVARPAAGPDPDGFSVVFHVVPTPDEVAAAERSRLARDLHDSISPVLYGIGLRARDARHLLDRAPQRAHEPIDRILRLTETGLAELRALVLNLRPAALAEEGLSSALATLATTLPAGYPVATRQQLCPEPPVAMAVKVALYLVAREAMQNAARHARAGTVTVCLTDEGPELLLEVTDDGVGFDPESPSAGRLGLTSMRERVAEVGGVLEVRSTPGRGTRVRARVPYRPAPH